jgi:hypothetical protein
MSLRLATLAVAIAAMSAISASAATATATDDFTGVDFTGVGCTELPGACTLNNAGADAAVPAFGAADPTCAAGYVAGLCRRA